MIYKIKDEYLEVINYCNEYDEYILKDSVNLRLLPIKKLTII